MRSDHFSQKFEQISLNLLDWLFPPACLGCGVEGLIICSDCFTKIELMPANVCNLCGSYTSRRGFCPQCARQKPLYSGFRAFAYYNGTIRKAIQQLKYHNDLSIGRYLAGMLEITFARTGWEVDLVVPVPIGELKREQRGYNQAERLAKPLSRKLNLAYDPGALTRIHELSSQVGLDHYARHENVRNAFIASSNKVRDKKILLVDDVFTSGATMQAAAAELIYASAEKVFCLALAKVKHESAEIDFSMPNNV
jgi:ComF family protein